MVNNPHQIRGFNAGGRGLSGCFYKFPRCVFQQKRKNFKNSINKNVSKKSQYYDRTRTNI